VIASDTGVYLFSCLALAAVSLLISGRRGKILTAVLLCAFAACFLYQYAIGRSTRWVRMGLQCCLAVSLLEPLGCVSLNQDL